jgi:IS1 family transposase
LDLCLLETLCVQWSIDTENLAATNGACVKELGRTNRKEKVVERVFKYWKRFLKWQSQAY